MSKVCIIIPAFNEELSIGEVIFQSKKHGDIVVVNDGSTDKTAEVSKKYGAVVIYNEINMGYDKTVLKGINYALDKDYSYILIIDADGQHPSKSIPKFIHYIKKKKYNVVIGNRDYYPRLSEKIFNYYSDKFYSIPDVLCGMKCYTSDFLKECEHNKYINSIGTYYLFKAASRNLKIKIINIKVKNRQFNSSKMGLNLIANLKVFKAFIKILLYNLFPFKGI